MILIQNKAHWWMETNWRTHISPHCWIPQFWKRNQKHTLKTDNIFNKWWSNWILHVEHKQMHTYYLALSSPPNESNISTQDQIHWTSLKRKRGIVLNSLAQEKTSWIEHWLHRHYNHQSINRISWCWKPSLGQRIPSFK